LALVVALGSGGAYAAGLAKNSVGSAQIKNGAVKAQDVKAGSLTGSQVKDESLTGADVANGTITGTDVQDNGLTGADVNESTLNLPATPAVFEGPLTNNATLSNTWATYATVTFTVPTAGYARLAAEASFNAAIAAADGGYLDALFYTDGDSGAYATLDTGDRDGMFDQHQTMSDVAVLGPGSHTVTLQLREHLTSSFSSLLNAHIDVEYFPAGSALPPLT
jgi:hypothetical protein